MQEQAKAKVCLGFDGSHDGDVVYGEFEADDVVSREAFAYRLVKSGPDVDPEDVELAHVTAVEIVILWESTILHVEHLNPPRSFYVGEAEGKNLACDYVVPSEKLGTTRAPIVLVDRGNIELVVLPHARGTLEIPGRLEMSLEEAARNAPAFADVHGARRLSLRAGAKVRMELDGLVFQVASVAAGKPLAHGLVAGDDFSSFLYVGFSLLAHAGLVAAMASFVPPLGLVDDEARRRDDQYLIQQYLKAAAEREEAAKESEQLAESEADERDGGSGTRAKNEEGSMGTPNTTKTGHRFGVQGPRDNPDPHVARDVALRDAAQFGMIGVLSSGAGGDPNAPTAIWGRDESLGVDPLSARGNMWGASIDDSFGAAGLGLTGVGEGGGQSGEGIGVGGVGTIFGGAGTGVGPGFGPGHGGSHGRTPPGHVARAPVVRVGVTTVKGQLPAEVIQRIVRQNYGKFRLCYESGLRNNPSLQGRVEVRFVIGRDGTVSSVSNGNSDLPDAHAVQCVVQAYYGLSFPQPEGGIVTVVYPIMFSPGN